MPISMRVAFCFLLSLTPALSQIPPRDSVADFMQSDYTADADGSVVVTHHARLRVLTERGLQGIAQLSIPYAAGMEMVEVQFLRTIKPDGKIIDADLRQASEVTPPPPPGPPVITDGQVKVLPVPDLAVGDAVEYQYRRSMKSPFLAGHFWFWHSPTRTREVTSEVITLSLPLGLKVAFSMDPSVSHTYRETEGRRIDRWEVRNALPNAGPGRPLFAVSTLLDWNAAAAWLRDQIQKGTEEATPEIRALASRLTAGRQGGRAKIDALYSYVANTIRYASVSIGIGRIRPHDAATVLRNGYGDCKDKHALLAALLASVGFRSHPVFITPGTGVLDPHVPTPTAFAHEFTAVEFEGKTLFLDATAELARPETLAAGVRGRTAFLVGDRGGELIEIPAKSPIPERVSLESSGRVDSQGRLTLHTRIAISGQAEPHLRRLMRDGSAGQKRQLFETLVQAGIPESSSTDPNDLSGPFSLEFEIRDPEFAPPKSANRVLLPAGHVGGAVALLSAQAASSLSDTIVRRVLPQGIKAELVQSVSLELPPDYAVDLPQPAHAVASCGSYSSRWVFAGGRVTLRRSLTIDFDGAAHKQTELGLFAQQVDGDEDQYLTLRPAGPR